MSEPTDTSLVKTARPRVADDRVAVMDADRFAHMYRVAQAMAAAALIPAHLKGRTPHETAANCFLVVNQAVRWNLCPFSLMAGTYVVGGKIAYEGKVVAAVVNSRAGLEGRLSYRFDGAGKKRSVTVSGTFRNEPEPSELTGDVEQWETQNQMWKKGGVTTDQKLVYTGTIWWARRYCPELVLGVVMEGEESNGDRAAEQPALVMNDFSEPVAEEVPEERADLKTDPVDEALAAANSTRKDLEDFLGAPVGLMSVEAQLDAVKALVAAKEDV